MHACTRSRARVCVSIKSKSKVLPLPAPASRSIMLRVTHASLLHCEPCYAHPTRQGVWWIYGGISTVIERYRAIVAVFIPSRFRCRRVASRRARIGRLSLDLPRPVYRCITDTSSCQSYENWLRRAPKILRGIQAREYTRKSTHYL